MCLNVYWKTFNLKNACMKELPANVIRLFIPEHLKTNVYSLFCSVFIVALDFKGVVQNF